MAALLRLGAVRRPGGSMVQRAQPAVAEERRRLGSKVMDTKEQAREFAREIQQRKEELYDVMVKAKDNPSTASFCNWRLLRYLAVEIYPRPYDSRWRNLKSFERFSNAHKHAGLFTLPITFGYVWATVRDYFDTQEGSSSGHDDDGEAAVPLS